MKVIKADCNICIKVHQRFDLAKWGVKKGDAYFKPANENLGKNGRWQRTTELRGKKNALISFTVTGPMRLSY